MSRSIRFVKPIYHRIVLKMSGEALFGDKTFGIDPKIFDRMANEVGEVVKLGVQLGLVIGGGNFFRGEALSQIGIGRVTGDQMGMLATSYELVSHARCSRARRICYSNFIRYSYERSG